MFSKGFFLRVVKNQDLPNNKILDLSKFKAFTDDKIIVTSNFSFSHNVFNGLLSQGHQMLGLSAKERVHPFLNDKFKLSIY